MTVCIFIHPVDIEWMYWNNVSGILRSLHFKGQAAKLDAI